MDTHHAYLESLESESISILREVAEEFEKTAILFSGGKDSLLLIHLAIRAFWPGKIPFKILHIDTGHNFTETLTFRDALVERLGLELIISSVADSIARGAATEETGPDASRNRIQSVTLLETIKTFQFDALIGGARRDEEKARAKERFFSLRNKSGEWDPKNQRPELWSHYNCKKNPDENFRVFPLNNWTERDVWNYVLYRKIEVPSLYFSHSRDVFLRNGVMYSVADCKKPLPHEKVTRSHVRFRTIGDITCTGAMPSMASSVEEILLELQTLTTTERGTRIDDKVSDAAMEDRKKQGYF